MIKLVIHDEDSLQIVMVATDAKHFKFLVQNKSGQSCFMYENKPHYFNTVVEAVEAFNIVQDYEYDDKEVNE